MNGKVLSFGELLLRICPDIEQDWIGTHQLPFFVGGAELNVASALALWNIPSAYLTAVPNNSICQGIVDDLSAKKIDVSTIIWTGERLGIYYLPKGKDLKHAGVIYDRAHSAFTTLKTATINWDEVFEDVSWFHFSAICPAISDDLAQVCEEALKFAQQKGIFISLDLNYRAKLWQYGKDPQEIMPSLAKYCNLIMGNIWAANRMLGIAIDPQFLTQSHYDDDALVQQSLQSSAEIMATFPSCQFVANTFRFDYNNDGIRYFTTLYHEEQLIQSEIYTSDKITDKVGSGDCFMAGLIYGLYQEKPLVDTLAFATAAAYDKLFIPSDATTSTVSSILNRLK